MAASTRRAPIQRLLAGLLLALGALIHPGAAAFDFSDLEDLIRTRQPRSIAELLPLLPADLLESYTLAHTSGSLQGASADNPRAILFGSDARLVLTFNGDPQQANYHELEVLHFVAADKRFELREIRLAGGVRISAPNPEHCVTCHGRSPRPLWGSYDYEGRKKDHWPGFYGSTHDAPAANPDEGAAFLRFRERAARHPRYRWLRLSDPHSDWYPYGTGAYRHRYRPNNRLGNLLARLNAQRVARLVAASAFFRRYQYVSLYWLAGCQGHGDYDIEPAVAALFAEHFPAEQQRGLYEDLVGVTPEHRLAFMYEKLLTGLDVYTWNMDVNTAPGGRRFFTGILSMDQLVAGQVLPLALPRASWLRAYYRAWRNREVYETFKAGYYASNVAPGGVGAQYDRLGAYFDPVRMRGACAEMARRAQAEIGGGRSSL